MTRTKLNLVIVIFLASGVAAAPQILAAAGASNSGRTLYVSPDGSDSNAGSKQSPLGTVGYALMRVAKAGDTVVLRGGTYRGEMIWLRSNRGHGGEKGRMLTVKAFPDEKPLLENCRVIVYEARCQEKRASRGSDPT